MIRRSGSRLLVTKKEDVLLDIPAPKLQGALLYGNVQVSSQCLRNLLEEGVWLAFFSRNGMYRGRLQPPVERGGRLRRRQWELSGDANFCLAFAKAVVRGKLLAQRQLASAHAKNYLAETLGTAYATLGQSIERVAEAGDLAELRGIEGSATRAYFDLFRRWNRSDFKFDGRVKHPSVDPINALLSLGYTLVTTELEGLLEAAGLDPTIGFYHVIGNDRPSLACDWVEEFRHAAIDRLVLNLVNLKVIKADDFEEPDERRGLRLRPDGLRKFLGAYEEALFKGTSSPEDDTRTPGIRDLFLGQLARLLDALTKGAPYRAYVDAGEITIEGGNGQEAVPVACPA